MLNVFRTKIPIFYSQFYVYDEENFDATVLGKRVEEIAYARHFLDDPAVPAEGVVGGAGGMNIEDRGRGAGGHGLDLEERKVSDQTGVEDEEGAGTSARDESLKQLEHQKIQSSLLSPPGSGAQAQAAGTRTATASATVVPDTCPHELSPTSTTRRRYKSNKTRFEKYGCEKILEYLRPTAKSVRLQTEILNRLRAWLLDSEEFQSTLEGIVREFGGSAGSGRDVSIELYGSSVNGFCTRDSDIDVTILHPALARVDPSYARDKCIQLAKTVKAMLIKNLVRIANEGEAAERKKASCAADEDETRKPAPAAAFTKLPPWVNAPQVIHARIPLVKMKDMHIKDFGIHETEDADLMQEEAQAPLRYNIDISFNNVLGYENSKLLRAYSTCKTCQDLGMLVKAWAKRRGLIDAQNGLLSSYAYMLLVIFFLQRKGILPNLQKQVPPEAHVRENFLYGCHDVTFDRTWLHEDYRKNQRNQKSIAEVALDEEKNTSKKQTGGKSEDGAEPAEEEEQEKAAAKAEDEDDHDKGTGAASALAEASSAAAPRPDGEQNTFCDSKTSAAKEQQVRIYMLLTEFFHFFAHQFNFHRDVVSVRLGQGLPKLKYLHYFRAETAAAQQTGKRQLWSCPLIFCNYPGGTINYHQSQSDTKFGFAPRHVNILIEDPFEKGQIKCPTYLGQERLCYEFYGVGASSW
eukprot:g13476.t1